MVTKIDLAIFGLAAIAIFFVIRGAGQALGNIGNPFAGLKFPDLGSSIGDISFPEIKFPDFNFPSFDFLGDIFKKPIEDISGKEAVGAEGQTVTFGENTTFDPNTGIIEGDTPPTQDTTTGETEAGGFPIGFFAQQRASVFDTLTQTGGLSPAQAFARLKDVPFGDINALGQVLENFKESEFEGGIGDPNFLSFLGLSQPAPPAQEISNIVSGPQQLPSNIQGFQVFQTEGSSFVGGGQAPIGALSLSAIIQMFGVSASQAANIKAIAQGNFGNFDFGTNTGSGIGSILGSIANIIPSSDLNVSSSEFEGLSASQIANLLTGGNISNF